MKNLSKISIFLVAMLFVGVLCAMDAPEVAEDAFMQQALVQAVVHKYVEQPSSSKSIVVEPQAALFKDKAVNDGVPTLIVPPAIVAVLQDVLVELSKKPLNDNYDIAVAFAGILINKNVDAPTLVQFFNEVQSNHIFIKSIAQLAKNIHTLELTGCPKEKYARYVADKTAELVKDLAQPHKQLTAKQIGLIVLGVICLIIVIIVIIIVLAFTVYFSAKAYKNYKKNGSGPFQLFFNLWDNISHSISNCLPAKKEVVDLTGKSLLSDEEEELRKMLWLNSGIGILPKINKKEEVQDKKVQEQPIKPVSEKIKNEKLKKEFEDENIIEEVLELPDDQIFETPITKQVVAPVVPKPEEIKEEIKQMVVEEKKQEDPKQENIKKEEKKIEEEKPEINVPQAPQQSIQPPKTQEVKVGPSLMQKVIEKPVEWGIYGVMGLYNWWNKK